MDPNGPQTDPKSHFIFIQYSGLVRDTNQIIIYSSMLIQTIVQDTGNATTAAWITSHAKTTIFLILFMDGVISPKTVKLITCFHDSWIYDFFHKIFFVLFFYKGEVFYFDHKYRCSAL